MSQFNRGANNLGEICTEGWTPLHWAAWNGDANTVRLLCSKGQDFEAVDGNGQTPLHLATRKGHSEIIKIFVQGAGLKKTIGELKKEPRNINSPEHRCAQNILKKAADNYGLHPKYTLVFWNHSFT